MKCPKLPVCLYFSQSFISLFFITTTPVDLTLSQLPRLASPSTPSFIKKGTVLRTGLGSLRHWPRDKVARRGSSFAKPRSAFVTVGDSLSTSLRMTKRFRILSGLAFVAFPSHGRAAQTHTTLRRGKGWPRCSVSLSGPGLGRHHILNKF